MLQDINRTTEETFTALGITYLQQLSQPTFKQNCHGWSLGFNLWISGFHASLYYAHYFETANTFEETTNALHNKSLMSIEHSSLTKVMYYTIPEGCEGAGQMFPANTYNGKFGEAGRYLGGMDLPERVYDGPTIWLKRSS